MSRHSFDSAFHKMNLSIFQLKKDRSHVCASNEVGNVSEEAYKIYTTLKNATWEKKNSDKRKANENKLYAFTSDVEAVKVGPFLKASALY